MTSADELLKKYYCDHKKAYGFLHAHSYAVANFATGLAEKHALHMDFVYKGALLHDIGIFKTHAPSIGCTGEYPYILHGILGAEILEVEGFPELARVCESHVGIAITKEEIHTQGLPLPMRDMVPLSYEEILIAYADKFFSKRPEYLTTPKPIPVVLKELSRFGERPVAVFKKWHRKFTGEEL